MQLDLTAAMVAVFGVSIAANGFFLKHAYIELRELQAADRTREVELARVSERVEILATGCPHARDAQAMQLARGLH